VFDTSDPENVIEHELPRCGEKPTGLCYQLHRDPAQCPNYDHWLFIGPLRAEFRGRFRGEILVEAD
jgi:hypothetical protein